MTISQLVSSFAENVISQTDAIATGDHKAGNQYAREYIAAFEALRAAGDVGRDALVPLLTHRRADVRVAAAAFLLRHRTNEAQAVLKTAAAQEKGLPRFEAEQALKRWEEGTWQLDPD
jgi:hypothetical protein